MASMYPLGGPRFRDGPRKVQASGILSISFGMKEKIDYRHQAGTSKGSYNSNIKLTSTKHHTTFARFIGSRAFTFALGLAALIAG